MSKTVTLVSSGSTMSPIIITDYNNKNHFEEPFTILNEDEKVTQSLLRTRKDLALW